MGWNTKRARLPGILLFVVVVLGGFWLAMKVVGGRGLVRNAPPSDAEARVNVLALCDAVQAYRDEHGVYVTAGPTPKEIPRGGRAVAFPEDPAFHRIGFEPDGKVNFQYQVVVQESPVGEPEVSCLARGDFDGDGLNSLYRVRLDANGMTTPIEVQNEGE